MSAELKEALHFEGREAMGSIQDMMAEMLGNVEEGGGYVRPELDDITVRKMLLARYYIEKDIEKMTEMKKAIVLEWDQRINKKKEDVVNIEGVVDGFVRHQNKGKSLSLDVATASMKRNPHKVKLVDEAKARDHFRENGLLESFLKPAPLDATLAQNYFMSQFEAKVKEIAEDEAKGEAMLAKSGKITKKREKEILLEVIDRELPAFNEDLPEGFELQMPKKTLAIRSNIK